MDERMDCLGERKITIRYEIRFNGFRDRSREDDPAGCVCVHFDIFISRRRHAPLKRNRKRER